MLESNDRHKSWVKDKLQRLFDPLSRLTVTLWGSPTRRKPTRRGFLVVELCDWLIREGVTVNVHDDRVTELPRRWGDAVARFDHPIDALRGAQALIITADSPRYRSISPAQLSSNAARLVVLDADRVLCTTGGAPANLELLRGRSAARRRETHESSAGEPMRDYTGACRGLGAEIAKKYLEAGASLMICARHGADLDKSLATLKSFAGPGQSVIARAADISQSRDVTALVDEALHEFGHLDILVNNAAVAGPIGSIDSVDWQNGSDDRNQSAGNGA